MRRTLAIAAALLLLAAGPAAADRKNETVAFVKFDKHVAILAKVGQDKSAFTFAIKATNKAFDDDVYVGSGPLKAKVSCFSFKSSSGFSLTVEPPRFSVSGDTLVIDQSIPRISVTGLHASAELGPCVKSSVTFGISASDIHFTYKAKPMLTFDGRGLCKLAFGGQTQKINVKIGGFNAKPLQNDLDKLVKKWLERSLEESLNSLYSVQVGNSFMKASLDFCGK